MKVQVTQADIDSGNHPIEEAIHREFRFKTIVDRKFIIFAQNPTRPFRMPLSAELFNRNWHLGHSVKPFSFEIAG